MRSSWLLGALVTFIIGFIFSLSIIGLLIGVPLIVLSLLILFLAFVMPEHKPIVRETVHEKNRNKRTKT